MKRTTLVALAIAQFVMVLDQSVMNVSISTLVDDFDTSVTTIQAVITLYSLVMAMFMMAGAKLGDIYGRRRVFVVGLVIYGFGSAITALAPTVLVLALGWSVLEGIGAALVLPALAALIAGNFQGSQRRLAYAVIGGVAGAGIAVGPILGGWATTELSWRIVFAGEVVLVALILVLARAVDDAPREGDAPRLDAVGVALSATALGLVVLGALQSSTWGWLFPKDSPITPFGFSLTPFVIAAGLLLGWAFVAWQRARERRQRDPLLHLDLLAVRPLRSGLIGLFTQNIVLMAIFFVIPLYLQLVLGLNALETGIKMLPVSIAMFVTSAIGARLARRFPVRTIVRTGLVITATAALLLLGTVEPELQERSFAWAMALLGIGMGLLASQLGNVVQSSVDASGRSEAGGLQYTGQQLGSSLGIALVGAVVLSGLAGAFATNVANDARVDAAVVAEVERIASSSGVEFVTTDQARQALESTQLDAATRDALVEDYAAAQLLALKVGLLLAALLALLGLPFTRDLPSEVGRGSPGDGSPGDGSSSDAAVVADAH